MYKLGSHWPEFRGIWYWALCWTSDWNIQIWLQFEKHEGHCVYVKTPAAKFTYIFNRSKIYFVDTQICKGVTLKIYFVDTQICKGVTLNIYISWIHKYVKGWHWIYISWIHKYVKGWHWRYISWIHKYVKGWHWRYISWIHWCVSMAARCSSKIQREYTCIFIATMVTRTRYNVTLYVCCLSCFFMVLTCLVQGCW